MTTKQCTKCKRWFEATAENFYQSKNYKGGLMSRCRQCLDDYRRNYQRSEKFAEYKRTKKARELEEKVERIVNPVINHERDAATEDAAKRLREMLEAIKSAKSEEI
jgi:hypothetical protein